ncbi:uncharacterized protein LOC141657844 [Silene latifolia]|uniref:uncharacterized protein LOC141657844 n=1 Tax=Silene latifolia TaxID=37657 RepID=UPI003D76A449
MGCGVSKLDPNQDDIPERIKPILQRRLEEIRAKKNNKNSDGHSKKDPLGEAPDSHESDNGEQEQNQDDENVATNKVDHTFNVTQDSPPTLQKINDEIMPLNDEQLVGECRIDDKTDDIRFLRKRHVSEGSLNIVEEEIDLDNYNRADLGRASPSFRVYCTDFPVEDDDLIVDEHVSDEDTMEDHRHSIGQESTCSNEVSVRHIPSKKSKRGRKFKITMPKGGKIYKNMQSFYYFPCSSQTNSNLLQKAAA